MLNYGFVNAREPIALSSIAVVEVFQIPQPSGRRRSFTSIRSTLAP